MPLPDVVDYDTLLFAPGLVARGGAVRPVVDELLAAASDPDRLQGIDPTVTRVRAADLLALQHDPALLDDAVAILREAVALALPGEVGLARDALAKTLAEQGNLGELDALVRAVLREPPSSLWALTLLELCCIATVFGYGRPAAGWLDQALATAAAGSSRPDRRARNRGAPAARSRAATIRDVLQDARKRMAGIRAAITADGCDPDDPAATRERMRTRPSAAATVGSYPSWPAGLHGRLVWWPEPEYVRLTRQLPEMITLLGDPWRGHTTRVQEAMSGAARRPAGADPAAEDAVRLRFLVAAEFGQFAAFLEWSGADPLAPPTMTAFGALAGKLPDPVRWPPRDRAPCWCGSGIRYRDCCARPGAVGQPVDAVRGALP
jgi:SEC-C motif